MCLVLSFSDHGKVLIGVAGSEHYGNQGLGLVDQPCNLLFAVFL